jgi:hypothetical protein
MVFEHVENTWVLKKKPPQTETAFSDITRKAKAYFLEASSFLSFLLLFHMIRS